MTKKPIVTKKEPEVEKARITTYIDQDILDLLHQMAKESGGKYQTTLNRVLRDTLLGEKDGLLARVERLEKKVFGKGAKQKT